MKFDKKYFSTIIITAVVVAGVSVIIDRQFLKWEAESQISIEQRYQDPKSSISFVLPNNWIVDRDESDNLIIYRQNPYLTVTFEVYKTKTAWQNQINSLSKGTVSDVVIKKESITLNGLATTKIEMERRVNGQSMFRYVEYFVDAGEKFYGISSADPNSDEIESIVSSTQFK